MYRSRPPPPTTAAVYASARPAYKVNPPPPPAPQAARPKSPVDPPRKRRLPQPKVTSKHLMAWRRAAATSMNDGTQDERLTI